MTEKRKLFLPLKDGRKTLEKDSRLRLGHGSFLEHLSFRPLLFQGGGEENKFELVHHLIKIFLSTSSPLKKVFKIPQNRLDQSHNSPLHAYNNKKDSI